MGPQTDLPQQKAKDMETGCPLPGAAAVGGSQGHKGLRATPGAAQGHCFTRLPQAAARGPLGPELVACPHRHTASPGSPAPLPSLEKPA